MGIEAALLGAPLMSATAGASTVGLIGAGGVLGGGALSLGTLGTALAGLSSLSSIMGGMQQNAAAKQQANMAEAQGILQSKENVRVAAAQAQQESAASDDARRRQKLAYLKAGVTLDGTPFAMMEDTKLRGERNVDEFIASGASSSAAAMQEGRTTAANYRASGRQALMAGIGNAAGTAGNYAMNR
jgi:hypothetical protein